ncbi:MAG: Penicillin-binding protein 4* [Planctomycetes bacterium ADurb.Bin126]|nr:MAG: Penicillin-binding protein 4* [Planctomycetes bacterium ADurb.Bin126]HOD82526.1 serine hydrolase domain-containing protein [Phycisphaerae bacterium]HQL74934.1 serine hydrolase domain-containing protein [Phycisphaerae bacterium]
MRHTRTSLTLLLAALACSAAHAADRLPADRQAAIDAVVNAEIAKGHIPGAVVAVGHRQGLLFLRAYGQAVVKPEERPMRTDTIFDLASLTKPVATAPCVLLLAERGKISLDDPVAKHLPAFAAQGKGSILIRHLLAHDSGLPAYVSAAPLAKAHGSVCPDAVIKTICSLKPLSAPGEKFRYSCLNYITLSRIVQIASQQPMDRFARENLFAPLGMVDTAFNPPPAAHARLAGTTLSGGEHRPAQVHDPLARLMGGVSGNAGAFSTAADLGRYCQALLNNGLGPAGRRVLSPRSVALLTTPQAHGRGYGFDVSSSYAWLKGDSFSKAAFCHSGFTGTSIVCDPAKNLFLIVLTNRVHPAGGGSVRTIRTALANLVAKN